jgi:hypothetical protein
VVRESSVAGEQLKRLILEFIITATIASRSLAEVISGATVNDVGNVGVG